MRSDTMRQRRLELGLARRDVAREVGVSEGAVARIERGGNADDWPVRQVRRLAAALGMTLAELLDRDGDAPGAPPDDASRIATLLAHNERLTPVRALAEALGWTLQRTNEALGGLDQRTESVGLRVQQLRGQVALRPRHCDHDLGRLFHREMASIGMSRSHGRTLHAVLAGTFEERHADANDRMSLAALVRAGLVDELPAGPRLSDAVSFGLDVEGRAAGRESDD